MKGLIFNIQRYALHDGPGIRTTVFFKGCPLKCKWCHNPESIRIKPELMYNADKCIGCLSCEDKEIVDNCPTKALEEVGSYYSVNELFSEIMKDNVFFEKSEGGVTFSGGEPLLQSDFLLEILKMCKDKDINTIVDTSGFSSWHNIDKIKEYVDIFLYDIKIIDKDKHKELTGVDNDIILANFKKLSNTNEIYIRVPIIKGINDSDDNISSICELANDCSIKKIYLLPYHNYSENKYKNLVTDIKFNEFSKPSEELMNHLKDVCIKKDLEVYIGG